MHSIKHIAFSHFESGCEFLQYLENISKTNKGGLCRFRVKKKVVCAYKYSTNAECCPVELRKNYLSYVSEEISNDTFYLRALPKPRGEMWYYNGPVGRKTLGNVIKKITRKAGFEGHLTNHSLRRSSATWLH